MVYNDLKNQVQNSHLDDFEEDFVMIDDQYRSNDVLHDDFENRKLDTVDNNDDQCNSVRRDQNYINGGNNIV